MKIKQITLRGIRGVKDSISIPLLGKSAVIYGDNGTGKSSITDSLEWFYAARVRHLISEEIDVKEALRNRFIAKDAAASVSLNFSTASLDAVKSIVFKNDKLVTEHSQTSQAYQDYLVTSTKENLILRFKELTDFIGVSKGGKLKELSDIIGFSEVTRTKEILKKSLHTVRTDLRSQNYEGQINSQKQILIDKLGAYLTREADLVTRVNELIKPFELPTNASSIADIDTILNHLKKPLNPKIRTELNYLLNASSIVTTLKNEIAFLNKTYEQFLKEFNTIAAHVEKILQTYLGELLQLGETAIKKKLHKDGSCPLCLKPQSTEELTKSIQKRLKEMEGSLKEKAAFDKAKALVLATCNERIRKLSTIDSDLLLNTPAYKEVKESFATIKKKFSSQLEIEKVKVIRGDKPPQFSEVSVNIKDFAVLDILQEKINVLQAASKEDGKTVMYSKITAGKDAFIRINSLQSDQIKFEAQKRTLEIIYSDFISKQKAGLELFINSLSDTIREFYEFMNPNEQFADLKIVMIGEEDNLTGVTVEFSFNKEKDSPPQKYFSESHLNCFGISFFLASVVAFNKTNKFFILDDVISSFDKAHRIRFANLLFEKFKDYQIILLTHEHEWFSYVRDLAKRNSWLIKEVKSTEERGTHFDDKPEDLKTLIVEQMAKRELTSLANPIRIYLERKLKEVALNLEVRVVYRGNEINEKRMPNELLNELKSRISECSPDLKAKLNVLERVERSNILANILSHDNPFNPVLGDLQAFWSDVMELEDLFFCQDPACTKRAVAMSNYDTVAKAIRCGCDKTKYSWKK